MWWTGFVVALWRGFWRGWVPSAQRAVSVSAWCVAARLDGPPCHREGGLPDCGGICGRLGGPGWEHQGGCARKKRLCLLGASPRCATPQGRLRTTEDTEGTKKDERDEGLWVAARARSRNVRKAAKAKRGRASVRFPAPAGGASRTPQAAVASGEAGRRGFTEAGVVPPGG